jgi:membrane fusion protein, multidrug efflux system
MKRKQIIVGGVIALAAVLGIVALVKSHGEEDASNEDESTPTIVTVQTGTLKLATLHRYVQGFGTVEPAPATATEAAADAPLAAPSAGVVTKVNVIEGQKVEKGAVLLELNAGAMTVELAEQELARQKKLFEEQNTSLKNVQNAEAQLAALRVTAPLSGTVTRLNVKPGQALDSATVVAEVMDLSRLAISAEIPTTETINLRVGEEVQILTEPPVTTALSFVSAAVNKDSGTVLVRALLPADGVLRPGQFVSLRIMTVTHTNVLVAPAESVVIDESGKTVIALVDGDEASQTLVKASLREDGWVEIAAPDLKAGDTVVTVGAYGLPDKTKIRVENLPGDEAPTNSADAK